jgi:hypothetical protein
LVKIVFFASEAIAFGFVLTEVPGATPKKPNSGLTLRVGSNPGDVVADGPNSPAFLLKMAGRNEHGKIRLATGARESCGNVGFLPLGVFDPEDEHVLGHPSFVPGNVRGNAKGETFFAEQGVAAVTGAIAPDFACFGEVDDVFVDVARPRDILLTSLEWSSY